MRNAAELALELGNFFALEEDAVGKPVFGDAPVDVRMVVLAVERHALLAKFVENAAKWLDADVEVFGEVLCFQVRRWRKAW